MKRIVIERTFQNIPEGSLGEADQQLFLVNLGWAQGTNWQDLLRSSRVLMISEAGAGKTYECRQQAQLLWDAGEPAFFVELTSLATGELRSQLDGEEEARLDAWLSSQSDVASFFLDSIDELELSLGSFERALKRMKKTIDGKLRQCRIIITTRPIPFDEQLVRRLLPVPTAPDNKPNAETFAKIAMGDNQTRQTQDQRDSEAPDWRTVALMPLSDAQIREFAEVQGIQDPAELLKDLQSRNAQEFARRPQDLIELCADWRDHKRIRTHYEQVKANVRLKLHPREDRREPAELSVDQAIEGASRLALAMMVMRRMTIRHSAASDVSRDEAALDPAIILTDWTRNERRALLERPLFGFASYGRVRFHHRSVLEYLSAHRLHSLRGQGMSFRALKRLIFAKTRGRTIVRPSMRPIAGWLALRVDGVFEMLRDNEPTVLLDEGDPESLSQTQRSQALRAYVERHGRGGWRGLNAPQIQVHRFASPDLSDDIIQLWGMGIQSPEVRRMFLNLIEAGHIGECASILHVIAFDEKAPDEERLDAVDAMAAIRDPRLAEIAAGVAAAEDAWPQRISEGVVRRLFPRHLSIDQLCQTLAWMTQRKRRAGDLSWYLPHLIKEARLDSADLAPLRDGLVDLLCEGLCWKTEWPHIFCDRPYLSDVLSAVCVQGLDGAQTDAWLYASVLALSLHDGAHINTDERRALEKRLRTLAADANARFFWTADAFFQSLHAHWDPWTRFAQITVHDGPVKLQADRDLDWIKNALGDTTRSENERAMLLEAAMFVARNGEQWQDRVLDLKPLVCDQESLLAVIEDRLKRPTQSQEEQRWKKDQEERKQEQEESDARNKADWIQFYREVAERPESVFSTDRRWKTACNLWHVMRRAAEDSSSAGWNRRFIEEQFGEETADRLRRNLMTIWRKENPTLPSERPPDQRNTYLRRWVFGLAAIYAEAEDPAWATELSEGEARLAARFAPIEFNSLPKWMVSLAVAHPNAVDAILGNELSWELSSEPGANGHSMLLQNISYTPAPVAKLFLSRLAEWLEGEGDADVWEGDVAGVAERLRQVIDVMLQQGDDETRRRVFVAARARLEHALPEDHAFVWLPALLRVNPDIGVSALEDRIRNVVPGPRTKAVTWFGMLFGDRQRAINLKKRAFTPRLLLRLFRLSLKHVRIADDVEHEGAYRPDTRDFAQDARYAILDALLESKGEEGWAAKLEIANDPLCAFFRDRILAVAEERWAQDMDSTAFDEDQAIALDKTGEAPASTNEAMFAILKDRLDDLEDLLLRDDSPKAAWAAIAEEKVMRRVIARELRHSANELYKVDQEAATAEEKKTDIRLRSVISEYEAVIELKLADNRTPRDLRDTIQDQLVTKYMAAENCKSGCLLLTLAKDRRWRHPETRASIDLWGLMSMLSEEARRVEASMGGAVALTVRVLDLRPR
ncbi:MAG: ATP-binding protein [Gammaproteobacteria bacterium]|nr:ATP-binding protein [Gammaproteobacteria bacterium]MDE0413082.1 ATP-binding protein [Gammaproteobacteria bacterium]